MPATPASAARTAWFAATPPATTMAVASGTISSAWRARSATTAATEAWKAAAMSACAAPPCATARATAVLSPLKEKSQPGRPSSGRGSATAAASPPAASRSRCGPPGQGRPISLAALSKASPTASSSVEPSRR